MLFISTKIVHYNQLGGEVYRIHFSNYPSLFLYNCRLKDGIEHTYKFHLDTLYGKDGGGHTYKCHLNIIYEKDGGGHTYKFYLARIYGKDGGGHTYKFYLDRMYRKNGGGIHTDSI